MSTKHKVLAVLVAVWALIVIVARKVLDWLEIYWVDMVYVSLLIFLLTAMFAQLARLPQEPCKETRVHKVSRAFPEFDDYMPLPNPKPEDCIIVPLENPKAKDIVEQRVLTTA